MDVEGSYRLKAGQALVLVHSFSISPKDIELKRLGVPVHQLGVGFSGRIIRIAQDRGTASSELSVDDNVLGFAIAGGAMARHVPCELDLLAKIPAGMALELAASIPETWMAAIQLVKSDARFVKRQRAAVFCGSTQLGHAVVQLLQLLGCRRVHCVIKPPPAPRRVTADEYFSFWQGQKHIDRGEWLLDVRRRVTLHAALIDEVVIHQSLDPLDNWVPLNGGFAIGTSTGNAQEYKQVGEYDLVKAAIAKYDPRGLEVVIDLRTAPEVYPEMMRPNGTLVLTQPPPRGFDWDLLVAKMIALKAANTRAEGFGVAIPNFKFLKEHVLHKIASKKLHHEPPHTVASMRSYFQSYDSDAFYHRVVVYSHT